jgi:hypothetical protein
MSWQFLKVRHYRKKRNHQSRTATATDAAIVLNHTAAGSLIHIIRHVQGVGERVEDQSALLEKVMRHVI